MLEELFKLRDRVALLEKRMEALEIAWAVAAASVKKEEKSNARDRTR